MEKLGLSVEEAAEAIGIGRSEMYEQIAAGNIETYKVGRRRLIEPAAARQFVSDRMAEARHGKGGGEAA